MHGGVADGDQVALGHDQVDGESEQHRSSFWSGGEAGAGRLSSFNHSLVVVGLHYPHEWWAVVAYA